MSKKSLFVTIMLIIILWASGRAVVTAYQGQFSDNAPLTNSISKSVATQDTVQSVEGAAEERSNWFLTDDESQWSDQELATVQQIMDRTWQALESVGIDGESLLAGYHFRRVPAEFVPGEERLLAIVDHQKMEILLADGAFERLHGFYIYHELGHAVDRQLDRATSEIYHRIASDGQQTDEDNSVWQTTTGYWLRYHGRDDREEATADAFAWWVMAQAGQPKPFFAGTPPSTDYDQIARTIEEAVLEAAAVGAQPA